MYIEFQFPTSQRFLEGPTKYTEKYGEKSQETLAYREWLLPCVLDL